MAGIVGCVVRSAQLLPPAGCLLGVGVGGLNPIDLVHRSHPLVQEGQNNGGSMWSATQAANLTFTPSLNGTIYSPGAWVLAYQLLEQTLPYVLDAAPAGFGANKAA